MSIDNMFARIEINNAVADVCGRPRPLLPEYLQPLPPVNYHI